MKPATKPKKNKILIVEDEQFLCESCEKKLIQAGYDTDTAIDGVEALRKIIKGKPDLILLDIIIPELQGLEVLEKVRTHKDKTIAKIPVIILSNLGQDSDVKKALALGANDYLVKVNFTIGEIIEKIQSHLK